MSPKQNAIDVASSIKHFNSLSNLSAPDVTSSIKGAPKNPWWNLNGKFISDSHLCIEICETDSEPEELSSSQLSFCQLDSVVFR